MIRLIINADDFGAGPGRDRGIIQAFRQGVLTSASLLANGPSFTEAARAVRTEGLPVGLHLNLSEGFPLAGPIPGLTVSGGEFPGKTKARRRIAAGLIDPGALARELTAQVQKILDAGIVPDHLDTHQHVFLFPLITEAALQTAREFGIPAIRLPSPAEPAEDDPGGPLGREMALYRRRAPAMLSVVRHAGVTMTDGLWGMPLLGQLDETGLLALLRRLPPGTWELMVHPGYRDPGHPFGGMARERELAALLSPAVRSVLAELNIAPITFRDLACAS